MLSLVKRLLILGALLVPNVAFAQTCIGTPPLTQIVVDNTINICLPTNNANEISALALRQVLQTMTSAIFQNISRPKLFAPTTFFVNTGGNDSNSCLGANVLIACATIQGAVNKIYSYDLNNNVVAISCAASQVFTGPVNLFGQVVNPASPTPVFLNCNNSTINVTGNNAIQVGQAAYLQLTNVVIQTTSSGNCIESYQNATVSIASGVVFNGCAGFDIEAFAQGYIDVVQGYTIAGSSNAHLHLTSGSTFNAAALTITINNTPNWSDWFMGLSQATAQFFAVTFSGSGTGQRYLSHKSSSIDVGVDPIIIQPETFLPGNSVGSVDASSAYLPYKAPTALACGVSPVIASTSSDWSGVVTVGSGGPTSCDILFNAAKLDPPNCTVINDGRVVLTNFAYISNNTGIATSFDAASGATLHWVCTPTGL